jgi:hypothetical protein
MISTLLVTVDYFYVIIFLLLLKIEQGYVLCAALMDFIYDLDKRQMLIDWEISFEGYVDNTNLCSYLQMFQVVRPFDLGWKQNS